MPSRPTPIPIPIPIPSPPPEPLNYHHHHRHHHIPLLPIVLPATLTLLVLLFLTLLLLLHRKLSRNRTTPSDDHQRRFSYTLLRRSASSFSSSALLGHGGFGAVYKATLPSGQCLALKVMDSPGSLQGEREFHNELSIASALSSPHILSLHGFSSDRRRRKLVLVYEYMPNRSLQDALLDNKCVELMDWKKRFDIAIDIAKGLAYLHHFCDPPVIHGDVKPSNILLDADFKAKIGDFGLARLKTEDLMEKREVEGGEDNGSILEETESVTTGFDEGGAGVVADRSPESCVVRILDSEASPENMAVSPEVGIDKASASDGCFDKMSLDSGKDLIGNGRKNGGSRRDWWWKQDINGGGSESGRVKDYVMEWIGSEIKKERPKSEWIASPSSAENDGLGSKVELKQKQKQKPKKQRKRLDWWASLDEERLAKRKEKTRKPREWWKEEFCEELSKKTKKKKRALGSTSGRELWWQKDDDDDEDVVRQERKKKRKNKNSRGSIDWWLDGLSGELRSGWRNSQDWTNGGGGDIPKSGGVSSTPSMRGTVCYIAPEYGGGGLLSEKCDVYSFGVLLLVIVSGRRPLQVTASPMSEFERANLISWARQLARNGKLLDLVDSSIHSLEKEQALLCITIALLCLQKSPSKRPTTKDIVGMLTGEAEPPHLPFEFSPSPPSSFPFKSRKKAR